MGGIVWYEKAAVSLYLGLVRRLKVVRVGTYIIFVIFVAAVGATAVTMCATRTSRKAAQPLHRLLQPQCGLLMEQ